MPVKNPNVEGKSKPRPIRAVKEIQQIITSLMDVDKYKWTMLAVYWAMYNGKELEYKFTCRCGTSMGDLIPEIRRQIDLVGNVSLTKKEAKDIVDWGFMPKFFPEIITGMSLDPSDVSITPTKDGCGFDIDIKGSIFVMLWETIIMSIISEVRLRTIYSEEEIQEMYTEGRNRLRQKIDILLDECEKCGLDFSLVDMGTRRRATKEWQEEVVTTLHREIPRFLVGTSNVEIARRLNIPSVGTMAHEFISMHQALTHPLNSQKMAFDVWQKVFGGALGIALSDTLGTDKFLEDFDANFANAFTGVRHDSGDPFEWGNRIIAHYEKLGIDPTTKTLVFSDGLDIPLALEIAKAFRGRIKVSFGIGTNLTNDFGEKYHSALSMVIKLVKVDGIPVAKISDNPIKAMCIDPKYLECLLNWLGLKV